MSEQPCLVAVACSVDTRGQMKCRVSEHSCFRNQTKQKNQPQTK